MQNIIRYIPPLLQNVREFKYITNVETDQLKNMHNTFSAFYDNQFIETLDEKGCKRYETISGLNTSLTDSVETRRFRIKAKYNEQIPFTFSTLKNQLENLCGVGECTVEYGTNAYTLVVRVALASKDNYNDICNLLEKILPCNMVVDVSIMYNQHRTLSEFTHGELSNYIHYEIRNEEIEHSVTPYGILGKTILEKFILE